MHPDICSKLKSALNLNHPGLAAVKKAANAGDKAGFTQAFAAYLRTRTNVTFPGYPSKTQLHATINTKTADQSVRRTFTVCGLKHTFKNKIDWTYNPTTAPGSTFAADHEWTWQFSRMSWWFSLIKAYKATGKKKYAKAFVDQICGWIRANPVPDTVQNVPFSRWRTIEAGIRAANTWPKPLSVFINAPEMTDEALCLIASSYLDHGRYLRKFHRHGNWLTMEMNGLYHAGTLFPEFKEAANWRSFAEKTLLKELDRQVYPDGAQKELTPGYHLVALRNMEALPRLAQQNNLPFPKAYTGKLERMYDFTMRLITPDRDNPPFNDSWTVAVKKEMSSAAELFPKRKDFAWFAAEGRKGSRPAFTSCTLPWAGFYMMRSSWRRDAHYLALEAGPMGMGHFHEDKLSFELYSFGRRIIADCGSYAYDASEWRKYVLSQRGHNTVFVDGKPQNRWHLDSTLVTRKPYPVTWETNETFDFAANSYGKRKDEGYGIRRARPATHTRAVLFIKPEFFIVIDTFLPRDKKRHSYQSIFHLDTPDPKNAVLNAETGQIITTIQDSPNLSIHPVSTESIGSQIICGQTDPEVQGWMPLMHGRRGVRPIPVASYTLKASGPAWLAYVMYPTRKGARTKISSLLPGSGGFEVSFTDGRSAVCSFDIRTRSLNYCEKDRNGRKKRQFRV